MTTANSPQWLDHTFTAPIEKDGAFATYLTVPGSADLLGTRRPVKVGGTIDGHPFAATGGRIVAALAKQLREKREATGKPVRGLVSICAAGGQGVVAILEA